MSNVTWLHNALLDREGTQLDVALQNRPAEEKGRMKILMHEEHAKSNLEIPQPIYY